MNNIYKFIEYQIHYSLNNFDKDGLLINFETADFKNRKVFYKINYRLFLPSTRTKVVTDDSYYIVSRTPYLMVEFFANLHIFRLTFRNPSIKHEIKYELTKEVYLIDKSTSKSIKNIINNLCKDILL